ncbi:MAG TPA: DUF1592 domain-containing protein [Gammaproteobacteria bacterium]
MRSGRLLRYGVPAAIVAAVGGGALLWHTSRTSEEAQWAMIDTYCAECHNRAEFAGGLAFEALDRTAVHGDAEVWEKVVRKLRGGLMPPPGGPRPEPRRVDGFVRWMEAKLDAEALANPNPGWVPLHRLNRKEYANAVRDLLALEIDPETLLPQDDKSHGFDNIAEALQVSPSFIEQYVAAARTIADWAVGNANATPESHTYRAPRPGVPFGSTTGGGTALHVDGLPLGTRDGFVVNHVFPADGEYRITISDLVGALWVYTVEFENTLIVTVDGEKVYETVLGGEADLKAIDQDQDPAVAEINSRLKNIRFFAKAGQRPVAVTFVRRTFAESDDRLHRLRQGFDRGVGHDRVMRVDWFEISGPFNPTGVSESRSRERIFSCYPRTPAEELPCAEEIVTRLATRAFRRPLSEEDVSERLAYYREGRQRGDFETGIKYAIAGILASPHFLYRAEQAPPPGELSVRLSDLELASRLSFFLWSSIPDDELRELAARGELGDPKVLRAQVLRMLADPRSESLASNFAYQWLHLEKIEDLEPDRNLFPHSSRHNDQRKNFLKEITLFVDSIFREDRSVVDLLTARHTFLNESLAWHYGINTVRGDRFRRVELEQSARWGLLGKGAVLLASSYPNRTSPVLRGAYVLENIIGVPPPDPPPNVETNLDAPSRGGNSVTVREKLAAHSVNPNCNSCHGAIDPLGFALENFDVDGRWRTEDRLAAKPIDSLGTLPDGTPLEGVDGLREALLERPEQFVQTFIERLLTYALGRPLQYYDMPVVRSILRRSAEDDYRFSSVVMGIVESVPFTHRGLPPVEGTVAAADDAAASAAGTD